MRVLFVDDEPNVLRALKRALRSRRHVWDMEFAEGAHQALAVIEDLAPDVLVTDMRMPGISGQELALKMRRDHPEILCIGLTGYCKPSDNLDSPILFHQFWSKPCPHEYVTESLDRIDALSRRLDHSERAWLVRLRSLPSASKVMARLLTELSSVNPDFREVGYLSKIDIGIHAKLVQLGSTSFCGPPREGNACRFAALLQEELTRQLFTREGLFDIRDWPELESVGDKYCRASLLAERLAQTSGAPEWVASCAGAGSQLAGMVEVVGMLEGSPFREADRLHRQVACDYLMAVWGVPTLLTRTVGAAFQSWETLPRQVSPEYFTSLAFAVLEGQAIPDEFAPLAAHCGNSVWI